MQLKPVRDLFWGSGSCDELTHEVAKIQQEDHKDCMLSHGQVTLEDRDFVPSFFSLVIWHLSEFPT